MGVSAYAISPTEISCTGPYKGLISGVYPVEIQHFVASCNFLVLHCLSVYSLMESQSEQGGDSN